VDVLTAAGYQVLMPSEPVCCGLTWISTGQLTVAERMLRRTLRVLEPHLRAGTPIVGLEPSCTAVFRSDAHELLPGDHDVTRLAAQTVTLAELLHRHTPGWEPPHLTRRAIAQTHCHQHAVMGFDDDVELMRDMGLEVDVLDAGCCGLAGNFGFEQGHYDVSRAVGEHGLLPAVRRVDADVLVLADGFSCRTQIEQGDTGRTPVHLAEVVSAALHQDEPAADRPRPSRPSTKALVGASAVTAGAVLTTAVATRRRR
jgi:Fe-S oxidoreductase